MKLVSLHRDYETRSAVDLRKVGTHRYAEDPSTDVILAVFIPKYEGGVLGEPVKWYRGQAVPAIVAQAAAQRVVFSGHNAAFEQAIDREIMGPRYGFPIIPDEQVDCTLARAAIMGLPQALGQCCKALRLKYQKDEAGHRLMLKMCKSRRPRKGEAASASGLYWHETPADIERLMAYCVADVYAEIGVGNALPPMSPGEKQVWLLDQRMNNRGVKIDLDFVDTALRVVNQTMERLDREICAESGGFVTAATQVERIKDYCKTYGVALRETTKTRRNGEEYEAEAADKEAIEDLLDGELPATVRRVLEIRLAAGKASIRKLEKFKLVTCRDGRARGNVQYHAAQPGRWAGRGIQMHNMRRDGLSKAEGSHEEVQRALRELTDNEMLELTYGSPLDLISRMTRGTIIAEYKHKLFYGDYSNVEGRGVAWAAGFEEKLDLFRSDGKIYETGGASIFGISVEKVSEGHETGSNKMPRFIGKETELGCGFGMGPVAFAKNVKKKTRIIIPTELARKGVYGWREANGPIVEYWRELEDAAKAAIENPGNVYKAGPYSYRMRGAWLQCRLPSGRIIWYCRPSIGPKTEDIEQLDEGETVPRYRWAIHYWTQNSVTRQWEKTSTWGGKLLQNNTEGLCRDFLAGAKIELDASGYFVILSVHDEAISEVHEDFGSADEFKRIMTVLPGWAAGFPLKAVVNEGTRYAK